jgi:hypothetical protein
VYLYYYGYCQFTDSNEVSMHLRMMAIPLALVWLLVGLACTLYPRSGRVIPVAVTGEVIAEAPDPTPVLACTPLEAGMKVTITMLDRRTIRLDLEGFEPETPVWFWYQTRWVEGGRTQENHPIATIGEDGRFSIEETLEDLNENGADHWDVRVVHSKGVACTTVTFP